MRRFISIAWALCAWLAWTPVQAQIVPTYDAFNGNHIDPAKWIATPMCVSNAYDCVREVQLGHLRLAARGYGDSNSDDGETFAASQLLFAHPESVGSRPWRRRSTASA